MEKHPGPLLSEGRLYKNKYHTVPPARSREVGHLTVPPPAALRLRPQRRRVGGPFKHSEHERLVRERAALRVDATTTPREHFKRFLRESVGGVGCGRNTRAMTTTASRRTRRPKGASTWWATRAALAVARASTTRRCADGYRVCLDFLSLASDQGGSPAEFKHISKRRKRN